MVFISLLHEKKQKHIKGALSMHIFHRWGNWTVYKIGTYGTWPAIIQQRVCKTCGEIQFKTTHS
jgi:hypothetical protein